MTSAETAGASAQRPLSGVRVLDLTRLLPGGLGTLLLADLGADVVKIEAPGGGDYARSRGPFHDSSDPSSASMTFIGLNRDKRSVELDLKTGDGRATLISLAAAADVVVESFRPGVMDRLGIGYETLSAVNQGLILCSLSGWGQAGPMAQRAGHDINYLATMGLLSPTGRPEDPPTLPAMQICDSAGGLLAALVIVAALRERDRAGKGQWLDVSLAHAGLLMSAMSVATALGTGSAAPARAGLWSGGVVCYQAYRCEDGWVALGALEEKFWTTWCEAVGRPELRGSRYEPVGSAAHATVTEVFAAHTMAEWRDFAAEHDCCLTVVEGLPAALASDVVADRGIVHRIRQPGIDEPVAVLGIPVGFSRSDATPGLRPAPSAGQDSPPIWSGSTSPRSQEVTSHA